MDDGCFERLHSISTSFFDLQHAMDRSAFSNATTSHQNEETGQLLQRRINHNYLSLPEQQQHPQHKPLENVPVSNTSALATTIANAVAQSVSNLSRGGQAIDTSTVANVALQEYWKIQTQRQPNPSLPNSQSLNASSRAQPYFSEDSVDRRARSTEMNSVNPSPNGPLSWNNAPLTENSGSVSHYPTSTAYSSTRPNIDNSKYPQRPEEYLSKMLNAQNHPVETLAPLKLPYVENMPQRFPSTYSDLAEPQYPKVNVPNQCNGEIPVQGNSAIHPLFERTNTLLTSDVCPPSGTKPKFRLPPPDMKRAQPETENRFSHALQNNSTTDQTDFLELVISAILEHPYPNTVTYYDICDKVNRCHWNLLDPDWMERIRNLLENSPAFLRKNVSKYVYWSVSPAILTKAAELWKAKYPQTFFKYTPQPEKTSNSAQSKRQYRQHSPRAPRRSTQIYEESSMILNREEEKQNRNDGRLTDDRMASRKTSFAFLNYDEIGTTATNFSLPSCNPAVPTSYVEDTEFHSCVQLEIRNGEAVVSLRKVTGCPSSNNITVPPAEERSIHEPISTSPFLSTTSSDHFNFRPDQTTSAKKEAKENIPTNDISLSVPEPSGTQKNCTDLTATTPPKAALVRNPGSYAFGKEKPVKVSKNPHASKPAPRKKFQISAIDLEEYQNLLFEHARLQSVLKETNERNSKLSSELDRTRTESKNRERIHSSEIADRDVKLRIVSDAINDLVKRYPADILKLVTGNLGLARREGERKRHASEGDPALNKIVTHEPEEETRSEIGSDLPMKRKRSPEIHTQEE